MAPQSRPRIVPRLDRQNAEPHFLTIDQVATNLSVSARTVRRWIKSGELPVYRIGRSVRIAQTDLGAFLACFRVSQSVR
jgi:excisionase family DNA binding protein